VTRTKNTSAAAELGGSLTALHDQAGSPAYRTIEYALLEVLGPNHTPTGEWIRKAHKGALDPYSADLLTTSALAGYYGTTLEDLHPALAERARLLRSAARPHSARADRGELTRAPQRHRKASAATVAVTAEYQRRPRLTHPRTAHRQANRYNEPAR